MTPRSLHMLVASTIVGVQAIALAAVAQQPTPSPVEPSPPPIAAEQTLDEHLELAHNRWRWLSSVRMQLLDGLERKVDRLQRAVEKSKEKNP